MEGGSQGWTNLLTLELIEQNESCAEMKRDCKAKGKRGPVSDGRLPRGETVRRHLNMHVTWKKGREVTFKAHRPPRALRAAFDIVGWLFQGFTIDSKTTLQNGRSSGAVKRERWTGRV